MRRLIISILICVLSAVHISAQHDSMQAIAAFLGIDSMEETDIDEVERLEALMRNPVRINQVSSFRLKETGLLTQYQIASLLDYRSRHGDVMSFSELAALDGFGHQTVTRLAPFISLETVRLASQRVKDSLYLKHEMTLKSGFAAGKAATYGLKYRLEAGEYVSASFSISRTSESISLQPDAFSGNMTFRFRKSAGAVTIGDFNARFGQGLALWNGMSIGGVPVPSSMMKRPAGISASSSFTGKYALRGIAGYLAFGRIRISPFLALSVPKEGTELLPGVNIALFLHNAQISFTHYSDMYLSSVESHLTDMKTSADIAFCFRGTDVFAEAAYDWKSASLACLSGIVFPAGDDVRIGFVGRAYPTEYSSTRSAAFRSLTKCSNEYSISLSGEFTSGTWIDLKGREGFGSSVRRNSGMLSLDAAFFPESKGEEGVKSIQFKVKADWAIMLSSAWKMKLRLSERVRTWDEPFRSEIRAEIIYDAGLLTLISRTDAVKCKKLSLLSYVESGYRNDYFAMYLRCGIFKADEWADRIYVYERDAPGSFNVPAYYGRGIWSAAVLRWRFARWGKAYLRASLCSYALMKEPKPGKAELRFQMEFDI